MRELANLPSETTPGGYPLFYVHGNDVLCPGCANQHEDADTPDSDVNWSNTSLHCDECDEPIDYALRIERTKS